MTATKTMHEPTAWMRTAIAAKVAQVDALDLDPDVEVITMLGRSGGRDDRTCDRCRHYVPVGPPFYCDMVAPRPGLRIVVGLCQVCRDVERGGR